MQVVMFQHTWCCTPSQSSPGLSNSKVGIVVGGGSVSCNTPPRIYYISEKPTCPPILYLFLYLCLFFCVSQYIS